MKRNLIFVLVCGAIFVSLMAVLAANDADQPNDPRTDETANACYTGGSMAGKCTNNELWIAGWYEIRLEYGVITRDQVPDQYKWLSNNGSGAQPLTTEEPNRTG